MNEIWKILECRCTSMSCWVWWSWTLCTYSCNHKYQHTYYATIHTYTYLTTEFLCYLQFLRKNWGKHVFTRIKNKIQKFGWRKICEKWSSYIWMSLSRISASGSICLCLLVLRFISISRKSRKTKSFSNVNMEINIRFSSVSRPQKKPVSGWF